MAFWVIALVFYVGSRWIADGSYTLNQFFVTLMSVVFGAIQAGVSRTLEQKHRE
jgi:ATP-binding cassette, subfamily B (MDR/TAP), member 1